MRYLYGDSVPFPQQYNFLSTLDAFVSCAVVTLKLDSEIARFRAKTAGEADARLKSVASLEVFHQGVIRNVAEGLKRTPEPLIVEYARHLQELAAVRVEAAKKGCSEANEREEALVRGDVERKRAEVRTALESFLRVASFPSLHFSVTMRFEAGANRVTAILTLPQGITTRFSLAASQVREWTVPRRVSEFTEGLVLKIGVKKGWMKKTVDLEPIVLDDYIVSGFELDESTAEIRLRRKPDQEDAFVFRAKRGEDKSFAEVLRPLDDGADAHASALDADDRAMLERFWGRIVTAVTPLLAHREALTSVALDGRDLFDHDRIVPFMERIVEMLAPVLVEVDRRSPNPEELSLKVEDEKRRREEIYLRKADLVARVEGLPADLRQVFDQLGLTGGETLSATDVALEGT
jgi:hypothetical protein